MDLPKKRCLRLGVVADTGTRQGRVWSENTHSIRGVRHPNHRLLSRASLGFLNITSLCRNG